MTWVRIDDLAPLHPKLLDAGPEAAWLWIAGLAHCNRCHTDGFIATRHLAALYPGAWSAERIEALAAQLVAVRLWHREPDGYRVHDYADFQAEATREAVDIRRQYERDRKAAQRARRASPGHVPDIVPDKHLDMSHGTSAGHVPGTFAGHDAGTTARAGQGTDLGLSQPPVPSRPVPSRPEKTETHVELVDGSAADAALSVAATKVSAEVRRVFSHWQKALEHPKARLDPKRDALIRRQLKAYSADELCRAIDGYASSAWHRGENDRGTRFDGLDLILRDATHVEKGWALLEAKPATEQGTADPWEEGLAKYEAQLAAKRAALAAQGVSHG